MAIKSPTWFWGKLSVIILIFTDGLGSKGGEHTSPNFLKRGKWCREKRSFGDVVWYDSFWFLKL